MIETIIELADGWKLICGGGQLNCFCGEDITILDAEGIERYYWHHLEWQEDPVVVMGSIMTVIGLHSK